MIFVTLARLQWISPIVLVCTPCDLAKSGIVLSKGSTKLILEELFNCKTGTNRIKAGLPVGWKLAHKTGTGSDVAGQNTGTNDVGIMVGPNGEVIYIAIFTKGSRAKIEARQAFMAKVAAKAAASDLFQPGEPL